MSSYGFQWKGERLAFAGYPSFKLYYIMDNTGGDYSCELYTTSARDYTAIKKSFQIDYSELWKEAEDKSNEDAEENDDLKCNERRKSVNKRGRPRLRSKNKDDEKSEQSGSRNIENGTSEAIHPISEEIIGSLNERCTRSRRKRRHPSSTRTNNAVQQTIGPTIILDEPLEPTIIDHISLCSDSETESSTMNLSLADVDDDNYEMCVKVWWKFDTFDKFTLRRYQKMTSLFEHYADLEKVPQSQVLLTLNDVQIHPNDTPDTLKLTVASLIEGGITTCENTKIVTDSVEPTLNENEIELKLQQKGRKEPILIRINKTQKMRVLMMKCAELLELPEEKLKFSFDGDALNPNETPVDLDMEAGDCIDLHVSS